MDIPNKKTAVYKVTFELEIALSPKHVESHEYGDDDNLLVEEAIDMLLHEEANAHRDGATVCGLSFHDAHSFTAKLLKVR